MFGLAVPVQRDQKKPQAWVLAKNLRAFYPWASRSEYDDQAFVDAAAHSIRFAGAALSDPETFDFIDINPSSIMSARRSINLRKHTNKPLVITSDNWYPALQDRARCLAMSDNAKVTPQHILNNEELRAAIRLIDDKEFDEAVANCHAVLSELSGIQLPKAKTIFFEQGVLEFNERLERGRQYRLNEGHIKTWSDEYEKRLQREVEVIGEKEFHSYFVVVSDMVRWAKQRMLVGPARGSSAGSLVCFLLQITEVDPLVHGLLFERFIDLNREDLPDIDIDFSDRQRDTVFEYLAEKYGEEHVARLGNVSTLKPRSVMAEIGKRMAIPIHETYALRNVLVEHSSGDARYGKSLEDTLDGTQPGKKFQAKFPEAAPMRDIENHAWHTSVHAAGVLVSQEPVVEFCSVKNGIAQIDKPASEYLNLLKIDALGLRTLGVIENTHCIDPATLYSLTLDDPKVLNVFNQHKWAGIFQFEGAAQRRVARQIEVTNFEQIDHIIALARPGPLGGGAANTYIARNDEREAIAYRHPTMADYLGDTKGVVLYQEQVMRIVREIGKFTWKETSTIRKAMSGRKGIEYFNRQREKFLAGAAERNIKEDTAGIIWEEICSFGAWGMNKSHTVSYAIISYWCAYMKAYFPLEFAAALLRNAKDDEQVYETLRELNEEGIAYQPFDEDQSQSSWSVANNTLIGGFQNIKGIGPAKAKGLVERRDADKLTEKDRAIIDNAEIKFSRLNPAHELWGDLYADPEKFMVNGPIKQIAELKDHEFACVICMVVRRDRRDENETVRLARRNGKVFKGQSLFLDIFVVDDSITKPILLRVKTHHWHSHGEKLADNLRDGVDWLLIRGKYLDQFAMISMSKIKVLTQPEMFNT